MAKMNDRCAIYLVLGRSSKRQKAKGSPQSPLWSDSNEHDPFFQGVDAEVTQT